MESKTTDAGLDNWRMNEALSCVRHYFREEIDDVADSEVRLARDVVELAKDEGILIDAATRLLAKRVGRGNLESYVDCLNAGDARKAKQS